MRKILCSLALLMITSAAWAQTAKPAKPAVREMPVTIVKGRPPGPGAFYVLERSNAKAQTTQLKKSFVPKIVGSVEQAPF